MLATRVRVRPCSDLLSRSSSGRLISSCPFSARATVIGSLTLCCSVPLGPLTETCWPSRVTSTPDGTGTGSLPMRDMLFLSRSRRSPDVGDDFATHAGSVRLLVGQQALGGRDDRDAEAAEDLGQAGRLRVHPQTGLGDAADAGDRALTVLAVLQGDGEGLADLALLGLVDRVAGDVTLAREDLGDADLDLAVRHDGLVVVRLVGVPETGQHVRNRVCHGHSWMDFFLTAVSFSGPTSAE